MKPLVPLAMTALEAEHVCPSIAIAIRSLSDAVQASMDALSLTQDIPVSTISTSIEGNDDDTKSNISHTSVSTGVSTDWEKEYGVDLSITPDDGDLINSPNAASTTTETTPRQDGDSHPMPPRVRPEERWYVVIRGRRPGVFQGYQNLVGNIEGISGNASFDQRQQLEGLHTGLG
ncbi:hypothetical protein H0H93_001856 [Arthromyces matolae]|nr:hypothetical protein H0H93_001856 [Arthromyces matolae]